MMKTIPKNIDPMEQKEQNSNVLSILRIRTKKYCMGVYKYIIAAFAANASELGKRMRSFPKTETEIKTQTSTITSTKTR